MHPSHATSRAAHTGKSSSSQQAATVPSARRTDTARVGIGHATNPKRSQRVNASARESANRERSRGRRRLQSPRFDARRLRPTDRAVVLASDPRGLASLAGFVIVAPQQIRFPKSQRARLGARRSQATPRLRNLFAKKKRSVGLETPPRLAVNDVFQQVTFKRCVYTRSRPVLAWIERAQAAPPPPASRASRKT